MDHWGVIILIQTLVNDKIPYKWVFNTQSHSDFVPNINWSCTPLPHIFVVSLTTIMLTSNTFWRWKLYATTMGWMLSEMSSHSGQRNDDCLHAVPGNWGAPKIKWSCLDSTAGGWQALFTLTVNCTLRSPFVLNGALKHLSLQNSRWVDVGLYNLFSDMSFGGLNIDLVRIRLSLLSKHWELRPHWVSVEHGWAGVAGHHAE